MIQEIAPHIYHNEFRQKRPCEKSIALYYEDRRALVRLLGEGKFAFPTYQELEPLNPEIYAQDTYLFSIDDQDYYWVEEIQYPKEYILEELNLFRSENCRHLGFAGLTGHQLYNWYRSRRFCGRCGSPMVKDSKERMMRCEKCGLMEYPKISPAVIIAVTHGNRLLLSKYAGRGTSKNYALIAGFCEIGETLEETVQREVMEEVGLRVHNIRYYKSQPWSFSDSLLVGFVCEVQDSEEITLDTTELALAQWFEREEIPEMDDQHVSMTHEMIRAFKNGKI